MADIINPQLLALGLQMQQQRSAQAERAKAGAQSQLAQILKLESEAPGTGLAFLESGALTDLQRHIPGARGIVENFGKAAKKRQKALEDKEKREGQIGNAEEILAGHFGQQGQPGFSGEAQNAAVARLVKQLGGDAVSRAALGAEAKVAGRRADVTAEANKEAARLRKQLDKEARTAETPEGQVRREEAKILLGILEKDGPQAFLDAKARLDPRSIMVRDALRDAGLGGAGGTPQPKRKATNKDVQRIQRELEASGALDGKTREQQKQIVTEEVRKHFLF